MSYLQPNKTVAFQHLGLMRYQEAWDYQTRLFEHILNQKSENRNREEMGLAPVPTDNYLLFCQHPHVYTLGKSGQEAHLLLNSAELAEKQAEYFHINRGGDITYHGPGQLVGYPVMDLDNFFTDVHRYLRMLEEAIIRTLAHYGIEGYRIEKLTGVWVGSAANPRKICAMGVKMSRWVTMHGFALNVCPDLSYFSHIVPCGITDKGVTSLEQELGYAPSLAQVERQMRVHLQDLFGMELVYPTAQRIEE